MLSIGYFYNLDPDPGPGPGTRTKKNLYPENPGSWKTRETAGCKKKIGRPDSTIYYGTKILQEDTCKQAFRKNSYWGFLGIEEMCLRLEVKMNSKAINK